MVLDSVISLMGSLRYRLIPNPSTTIKTQQNCKTSRYQQIIREMIFELTRYFDASVNKIAVIVY